MSRKPTTAHRRAVPNLALAAALAAAVLAGCSPAEKPAPAAPGTSGSTQPTTPSPEAAAVAAVLVAEAPPGASAIPATKKTAQPGDTVTLQGKVMGALHPFVENRAVVIIGDDATLASCDENEDDACETPWDCCCDTREIIQAGIATVQVVDSSGAVVKHSLKGVGGGRLVELSEVVVKGTVSALSTPESLVVDATAIYAQAPPAHKPKEE